MLNLTLIFVNHPQLFSNKQPEIRLSSQCVLEKETINRDTEHQLNCRRFIANKKIHTRHCFTAVLSVPLPAINKPGFLTKAGSKRVESLGVTQLKGKSSGQVWSGDSYPQTFKYPRQILEKGHCSKEINYFSIHQSLLCAFKSTWRRASFLPSASQAPFIQCAECIFFFPKKMRQEAIRTARIYRQVWHNLIKLLSFKWYFKVITFQMKRWTAWSENSLPSRSRDYTLICQSGKKIQPNPDSFSNLFCHWSVFIPSAILLLPCNLEIL